MIKIKLDYNVTHVNSEEHIRRIKVAMAAEIGKKLLEEMILQTEVQKLEDGTRVLKMTGSFVSLAGRVKLNKTEAQIQAGDKVTIAAEELYLMLTKED